ncbi:MAG TPA: sulfatase [Chloroflexota bacterium]
MPLSVWRGFVVGVLLGLLGGLIGGVAEGLRIWNHSSAGRAGAPEAMFYALAINGVALAAALGIIFALVTIALRLAGAEPSERTLGATWIAAGVALSLGIMAVIWQYPARTLGIDPPSSRLSLAWIPAFALAVGLLVWFASRPFGPTLARQLPRVGILGFALAFALGLALPADALWEARVYAQLPKGSSTELDMSILDIDYAADLPARLAAAQTSSAPVQPLNVVMLSIEDLRPDYLGFCGNPWISTPSLDLLASYGARSCNTYTQQPQSNPSLAALLTSTYPPTNGVRLHMVDRLPDSFDTIAKELEARRYTTAAILPWTAMEPAFSGLHQGFNVYEAYILNQPATLSNPVLGTVGALYRRATDQVGLAGDLEAILGLRSVEGDEDGRADLTSAAALHWLAERRQSPFVLWVHFFDPHYPWTPPAPYDQIYDDGSYEGHYDGGMGFVYEMHAGIFNPNPFDVQHLRHLYAGEVSYADHYVGEVLGYLGREGLLDNTLIVLTSDEGQSLGDRGGPWPYGDYWLHGDDVYTQGTQVPLIVVDPRHRFQPQQVDVPLQHIDIMPTILDLLGLPVPSQAQGRSIVPLLTGADDGRDRYAISTLSDDSRTSFVAADGYKLIVDRVSGDDELYYLPDDPGEQTNLIADQPAEAALLQARLAQWAQINHVHAPTEQSSSSGSG